MKQYPNISDSENTSDSDSSIDLDFGSPTPKMQAVSPETVGDEIEDNNLTSDDCVVSDASSDDDLEVSVSYVYS